MIYPMKKSNQPSKICDELHLQKVNIQYPKFYQFYPKGDITPKIPRYSIGYFVRIRILCKSVIPTKQRGGHNTKQPKTLSTGTRCNAYNVTYFRQCMLGINSSKCERQVQRCPFSPWCSKGEEIPTMIIQIKRASKP